MAQVSSMRKTRTSLEISRSVLGALFLRECLGRLSSGRAAWFWLLAEPALHMSYILFIFTVNRVKSVGGIDPLLWLMVGMLGFFLFRRTGTQVSNAVSANKALFTYRQVLPIDTLLVRAFLEVFLMTFVAAILLAGAALLGHSVLPADPLAGLEAFAGLWLLGMGFGLVACVASELVSELGRVINFVMMPMYLLSGVLFPLSAVPMPYRDWLMLNPVAHGLEAARLAFKPLYHAVDGLSISYIYGCALACIFLGLALQRRFAMRMVTA
jgi:capsular polysaccharide transport system permease protein